MLFYILTDDPQEPPVLSGSQSAVCGALLPSITISHVIMASDDGRFRGQSVLVLVLTSG